MIKDERYTPAKIRIDPGDYTKEDIIGWLSYFTRMEYIAEASIRLTMDAIEQSKIGGNK